MDIIFSIYFFLLGSIIGSFLNVVIYRFNTGRGILGRSQCFSCKRTLAWYDLVPVFSFLFQGAKCRTCKSKISLQYPLIELFTGVLFFALYLQYAQLALKVPVLFALELVFGLIQISLLTIILVYDLRHKIIPNAFVYTFSAFAFVHMFLGALPTGGVGFLLPTFAHFAAGPILAFPFYLIWLLSGGRWMGLGDAKLALGMGWFLGLSAGGSAIMLGFWIGAVVSVALLLLVEIITGLQHENFLGIRLKLPRLKITSEVPFAPFLIAGLLIVFFFRYNIFEHLLFR